MFQDGLGECIRSFAACSLKPRAGVVQRRTQRFDLLFEYRLFLHLLTRFLQLGRHGGMSFFEFVEVARPVLVQQAVDAVAVSLGSSQGCGIHFDAFSGAFRLCCGVLQFDAAGPDAFGERRCTLKQRGHFFQRLLRRAQTRKDIAFRALDDVGCNAQRVLDVLGVGEPVEAGIELTEVRIVEIHVRQFFQLEA